MSLHYPQSEFAQNETGCDAGIRPSPGLSGIVDEDIGRGNPLLGFLIAMPIGAIIWAPLIAIYALR